MGAAFRLRRIQRRQNPRLRGRSVFTFAPGAGRVGQRAEPLGGEPLPHLADGGRAAFEGRRQSLVFLPGCRAGQDARPLPRAQRDSGAPQ